MAKQTFTTGQVLTAAQMTSLQQTAMGGGSPVQKTASYVLTAADAGTTIQMNSASPTTITVNTALFAAGDTVFIQNIGAGACTVTAGTATVTTAGSLVLTQWEGGTLYFTSTSASIFFDYIQAGVSIPLTTKGDLFGFDTANARIPIGTNGQVLTADSAQALGLKWASPTGSTTGTIIQVVSGTYAVSTSSSTTTMVDTGLTATITPTSATSKILVLVTQNGCSKNTGNAANSMTLRLMRGATSIGQVTTGGMYTATSSQLSNLTYSFQIYDSPATTSATIYKTQFSNDNPSASVTVQDNSLTSRIFLLEIGQ